MNNAPFLAGRSTEVCGGPKRLFIVPSADHVMSYVVNQAGYQAAMVDFCEQI